MPSYTFRSADQAELAQAVLVLLSHARSSMDEFSFGPRTMDRLAREGLTVKGKDADAVAELLRSRPGLTED